MPTKKNQSNSKAAKKKPIVEAGQRPDVPVGVKDCLVWPNPGAEGGQGGGQINDGPQPSDRFIPTKAEIGKSKNRGYELPPQQYQEKADDGTVIEALRGWPHSKRAEDDSAMFWGDSPTLADKQYSMYVDGKPTSGKKSGKGKKCKKGGEEEEGDPHIVDLMAHRYMNDAIRKRQEEEERRNGAEAEAAKPDYKNPKSNRTAQLRAIAGTEKAYPVEKELWKMPKFEKNAKPHISTKREKARQNGERGGDALNNVDGNKDEGYVCTCPKDYDYLQVETRPLSGQSERDYELEQLKYESNNYGYYNYES